MSARTCVFNSIGGATGGQIYCDINDDQTEMDGIQAVCTDWRGSELQLDMTELIVGHNNLGGVGNNNPYGDDDGSSASQACALCKGENGFMNQGPCVTGTGQNHGACYWKAESCKAEFEGHVIYDRWWQGTTGYPDDWGADGHYSSNGGRGLPTGDEENCMRLKQRTGPGGHGQPAPTQPRSSATGASNGAYFPHYRPQGGDVGEDHRCTEDPVTGALSACETLAGGVDDCCYPGVMLADVVINIPTTQQVDLWIYPSYMEPNLSLIHI